MLLFFLSSGLFGKWIDTWERDLYGVKKGVTVEDQDVGRLLENELRLVLQDLALRHQRLPQNPGLDRITGEIIPEKYGVYIDIEQNLQMIMAASEYQAIELQKTVINPLFTQEDLKKAGHCLGEYTTFISGSAERQENIRLASTSLNNLIIWPGEVFSFNQASGPKTPERGYKLAPVILSGEMDFGYGGGVCQVSSTLFNACMQAKLEIIERHPHSKPVHYVPADKDAAVNYGFLDFRFKNNQKGPLIMKAGVKAGRLSIKILGGES